MSREPLGLLRAFAGRARRGTRAALTAPIRRYRAHHPTPTVTLTHAPHPYARALGLISVTLLGAWLGLLIVGSVRTPVGPMDTTMTLRPSMGGGTKINVPPLGALEMDSHYAPLRLDVTVDQLDPERSGALVSRPERFSGLQQQVTSDIQSGTRSVAVRAGGAVVTGATALGLAVYRRPGRALTAGGLALALLAFSGTAAYATWNPKSVLEPKFSGLLSSAPSVVGNARSIVTEFDVYQQELARLVTNMTKLYDVTSTLPAFQPDPGAVRVLHVSDLHLNPASWRIMKSMVDQYEIDVIIDAGDTMDHGTAAENRYLDAIPGLGVPYVWVRGNHDSITTQEYISELDGVRVLDNGESVNVAGLRIAGFGDPQFTPDRSVAAAGDPAEREMGRKLAAALRAERAAGNPVDIAVTHNSLAAEQTDGLVPLALAGHNHKRSNHVLPKGTRLMIEGTTGGGGLRAVENDKPQKVQASVLYLDRRTKRLQAWDEITLGGLGQTTAEVSRRLPEDPAPASSPSPSSLSPSSLSPSSLSPSSLSPSSPSPSSLSPSSLSPSSSPPPSSTLSSSASPTPVSSPSSPPFSPEAD